MLTGINSAETRPFVSKSDPDKDNPTVFQIGVLDSFVISHIEKLTNNMSMNTGKKNADARLTYSEMERDILYVRHGLKDLKNFIDPQTQQPVVFETVSAPAGSKNVNIVSEKIIKMIPPAVITELAAAIRDDNAMSETESKN